MRPVGGYDMRAQYAAWQRRPVRIQDDCRSVHEVLRRESRPAWPWVQGTAAARPKHNTASSSSAIQGPKQMKALV